MADIWEIWRAYLLPRTYGNLMADIWELPSKTVESQLKKVIYGLSLHSSVFYPATLETLSLAFGLLHSL
jgi:hypothetical protein